MRLYRFSFSAMASEHEIQLYADNDAQARSAAASAIDEVRRIERRFSRYRDDSLLTEINRAAGRTAVTVDAESAALLDYAQACYRKSDGLFDITSGVLRRCWNFRVARLPDQAQLAATLKLVGWEKVQWDRRRVFLPKAGMELDFGGIGKEYAADRAAAALMAQGIVHGLVNLAGDIRVTGPQADASAWRIGIQHPRKPGDVIAGMEISEGALATSGDYERFFELGGKRYCHVLNPRTGYPVSALMSVTVLAPLCSVAGSLSTIAMLRENDGPAFLGNEGVPYLVIDENANVRSSAVALAKTPSK
jgi:FAD:protein FMN transferase